MGRRRKSVLSKAKIAKKRNRENGNCQTVEATDTNAPGPSATNPALDSAVNEETITGDSAPIGLEEGASASASARGMLNAPSAKSKSGKSRISKTIQPDFADVGASSIVHQQPIHGSNAPDASLQIDIAGEPFAVLSQGRLEGRTEVISATIDLEEGASASASTRGMHTAPSAKRKSGKSRKSKTRQPDFADVGASSIVHETPIHASNAKDASLQFGIAGEPSAVLSKGRLEGTTEVISATIDLEGGASASVSARGMHTAPSAKRKSGKTGKSRKSKTRRTNLADVGCSSIVQQPPSQDSLAVDAHIHICLPIETNNSASVPGRHTVPAGKSKVRKARKIATSVSFADTVQTGSGNSHSTERQQRRKRPQLGNTGSTAVRPLQVAERIQTPNQTSNDFPQTSSGEHSSLPSGADTLLRAAGITPERFLDAEEARRLERSRVNRVKRGASKELFPDFASPANLAFTRQYQAVGKKRLLTDWKMRKMRRRQYAREKTKELQRIKDRYRKSPGYKLKKKSAALERYKEMRKGRSSSFQANLCKKVLSKYGRSPRTKARVIKAAKVRYAALTPRRKRKILLLNQLRSIKIRKAISEAKKVYYIKNRQQILGKSKKSGKRQAAMSRKSKAYRKISRNSTEGRQVSHRNFVKWAKYKLLRSYQPLMGFIPVTYFQRQSEVTKLVEQGLRERGETVAKLGYEMNKLRSSWTKIDVESPTGGHQTKENYYQLKYGSLKYHVATCEPYGFKRESFNYMPLAVVAEWAAEREEKEKSGNLNNSAISANDSNPPSYPTYDLFSAVQEVMGDLISSTAESFGANESVSDEVPSVSIWSGKARLCDANCKLSNQWGLLLHVRLAALSKSGSINDYLQQMYAFECCDGCSEDPYPTCRFGEQCRDTFKSLLWSLQSHYVGLRTLTRQLYTIRSLVLWLIEFDSTVCEGDWEGYVEFIKSKTKILERQEPHRDDAGQPLIQRTGESHEDWCLSQYGHLGERWRSNLMNFRNHACDFCLKMYQQDKIRVVESQHANIFSKHGLPQPVMDSVDDGSVTFPANICEKCMKAFKSGEIPKYSRWNGMGIDEVPEELQGLNMIEKMLLQLAKTFMTIIKMQPRNYKGPASSLTNGMKGSVVHLPLPSGTAEHTFNQLPSRENMAILVDSMPTKSKIIWQSVVSIDKWEKALRKLQEINPLYANVSYDATAFAANPPIQVHTENWRPQDDTLLERVPEGETFDHFTVMRVDKQVPLQSDTELFMTRRVTAEPLMDKDEDLDTKCYPLLFPKGRFGMYAQRRDHVRVADYIKHRMEQKDPRWRRDIAWILDMTHLKEMRHLESGIYATMNVTKHTANMNAGRLREMATNKHQLLEANLFTTMSRVPGTQQFWGTVRNSLDVMDQTYGPCTFFVTLSSAEYEWEDLRQFLISVNQDIPDVHNVPIGTLCANDPIMTAIHCQRRFDTFFNDVIMAEDGPLGEVEHYAIRLEYQARGSPHWHIKLWIKGAPIVGRDDNQAVINFIEKYITCEAVNEADNPRLGRVVKKFQTHKCGSGCLRPAFSKLNRPNTGNQALKRCRAGFPRPVTTTTKINDMETVLKSRGGGKKVVKLYHLKRTAQEQWTNDYNLTISLMWGCNIDVQFLGENSNILNLYLSGYITKAEKSFTEAVWSAVDKEKTIRGQLKSFGMRALRNREMGAIEAAQKLFGTPLFKTSCSFKWLGLAPAGERRRSLKKWSEISEMPEGCSDVFHDNWIDVYYPQRPNGFEGKSLFELASNYDVVKYSIHADGPTEAQRQHPQLLNGKGYFNKRKKTQLLTTQVIKPTNEDTKERYFHNLMMLYWPWRTENELLGEYSSFTEAFVARSELDEFQAVVNHHRARLEIEEARKTAQELQEQGAQEQADLEAAQREIQADADADAELGLNEAIAELGNAAADESLSEEGLQKLVDGLNKEQRKIYDQVMAHLVHEEKHKAELCTCAESLDCRWFVSGVAGTGKSYVIATLVYACELKYGVGSVCICAPTGLAALNVNGVTVHKLLKLPVQHGEEPKYMGLSKTDVKKLRMSYNQVRLYLLDEVSMVSNITLLYIHLRFNELFGDDETPTPFAGQNLVVFGDMLQLPPVRSDFCFQTISGASIKKRLGALPRQVCLWSEFKYVELTQNMRQREDNDYAVLLDRARIGSLTDDDVNRLEQRLIWKNDDGEGFCVGKQGELEKASHECDIQEAADYYIQLYNLDHTALCLMPTNDAVSEFNQEVMKKLKLEPISVLAEDMAMTGRKVPDRRKKKGKKGGSNRKKKTKASDTAGLEDELILGVGCRVMLRRNVNQELKLVNGSLGTLLSVTYASDQQQRRSAHSFTIQFDGVQEPYVIEKVTASYQISEGVNVNRTQFPLSMAYAITIHKSQGLSLNCVMIDAGKGCFESAMAYVAFSRCRKLENVHLIRLNVGSIRCKVIACKEYNRLRSYYTELPNLPAWNVSADKKGAAKKVSMQILPLMRQELSNAPIIEVQLPTRQPTATTGNYFLPLDNPGTNACFCNSVMQMFFMLDHDFWNSFERFSAFDHVDSEQVRKNKEVMAEMLSLWRMHQKNTRTTCSTMSLRKKLDASIDGNANEFSRGIQHDGSEFLEALLNKMSPDITDPRFVMQTSIVDECLTCKTKIENFDDNPKMLWRSCLRAGKMSFPDLMEVKNYSDTRYCNTCNRTTPQISSEYPHFLARNERYLIVHIQRHNEQGVEIKGSITGLLSSGVRIGYGRAKRQYKPFGAIQHFGANMRSGHYVAWRRIGNEWDVVSDDHLQAAHKRSLPNGLAQIYLVFLKEACESVILFKTNNCTH